MREPRRKPRESHGGTEISEHKLLEVIHEITEGGTQKINEGANGVIFKLNPETSQHILRFFSPEGQEPEQVIKLLKIYSPGSGKREFDNQNRAYEIAKSLGFNGAKVPKPNLFLPLKVTAELREFLQIQAPGVAVYDEVEILVMDYVPGVDLATWLFQNACKFIPGQDPENLPTDFKDLEAIISNHLVLEKPAPATSEADRMWSKRETAISNAGKIISFLKKNKFILNKKILEKILITLEAFKANKFIHGDLHERNVMIVNPESDDPKVMLIDFATSGNAEPTESTGSADDYYLIETYRELAEAQSERNDRKRSEGFDEVRALINRSRTYDEDAVKLFTSWTDRANSDPSGWLELCFTRMVAKNINISDERLELRKVGLFLAICDKVIEQNSDQKASIIQLLQDKLPLFEKSVTRGIIATWKNNQ